MIFKFEQTRTSYDMEYFARDIRGKTICIAKAPFQVGGFNIYVDCITSEYRMYFNNRDTTWGTSSRDRYKFRIFDKNDSLIGESKMIPIKVDGFLQSYWSLELDLNGVKYNMYEVGFGKEGLFLCFYREDKELVAIAEKELKIVDFKDKYTVYSVSDEDSKYIAMLLLNYDVTQYGDVGEIAVKSVVTKSKFTISKEAKAKFDPEFIPRIKAMHGDRIEKFLK